MLSRKIWINSNRKRSVLVPRNINYKILISLEVFLNASNKESRDVQRNELIVPISLMIRAKTFSENNMLHRRLLSK